MRSHRSGLRRRALGRARDDVGSAALLLIGGVSVVAVCVGLVAGALATSAHERLTGQTEEMAIAGADTLSGRLPGYPCQSVTALAAAQGLRLESCVPVGLDIRIVVSSQFGAVRLSSHAHAGPPIR